MDSCSSSKPDRTSVVHSGHFWDWTLMLPATGCSGEAALPVQHCAEDGLPTGCFAVMGNALPGLRGASALSTTKPRGQPCAT